MSTQILAVDDDPQILKLVSRCLNDAGYDVLTASTLHEAEKKLSSDKPDLALIDLGLPDGDGLALARSIADRPEIGVVILTGRADAMDKVIGLEIGADDYVTKPFEPRELVARCRSVLRRVHALKEAKQQSKSDGVSKAIFGDWSLDLNTQILEKNGEAPVDLSVAEFELLRVFVEHPRRILSRDLIMDLLHGTDTPAFDRSIDVRISRLRSKIENNPKRPNLILTARNRGYRFNSDVTYS